MNNNNNPYKPINHNHIHSSNDEKNLEGSTEERIKEIVQPTNEVMISNFGDYVIRIGKEFNEVENRLKKDSITDELCSAFNKVAFALEKAEDALRMEEERHSNKFEVGEYDPFIHFKCLPKHIQTQIKEYGEERVNMGKIREWMTNQEWFQFEISVSIEEGIWETSDILAEMMSKVA